MIEHVVSVIQDQETPVSPSWTARVRVIVDGKEDGGVRERIEGLQDDLHLVGLYELDALGDLGAREDTV